MRVSAGAFYRDFIILSWFRQKQRTRKWVHSRYRKAFYRSLGREPRRRRDRRIPRIALQDPHQSAWRKVYNSQSDQAMITLTGLDRAAFHSLLECFQGRYNEFTPHTKTGELQRLTGSSRGRPRLMSPSDCLALYLAWTRLRGSNFVLSMIFGMTGTSVSVYLRFARRLLIATLQRHPLATLVLPTPEKIEEFRKLIADRHPALANVWCTMDGLKLYLEQSPETVIQSRFFNGWTHDHYVTSVLVFCPDGTIPMACYNVPGSVHDSTIAEWGGIYAKLQRVYDQTGGATCTVDSAFCRKEAPFLIKSSQTDPVTNSPEELLVNRDATSMRQAAEWGMRSLQSSFPRLKERLVYEEAGERRFILKLMILLYNYRARTVGVNQIRNTYMPNLEIDANEMYVLPLME